jgi:hypothetical protein
MVGCSVLGWKPESSELSLQGFVCEAASDGVWRALDHEYIDEGKNKSPSHVRIG